MKVFIDTGALIALFVKKDYWHKICFEKHKEYKKENSLFFTNLFVLSEFYTRILYDYGKSTLKLVMDKIIKLQDEGKLRIFQIDSGIFKNSEEAMIKFAEHRLSFTDVSIYALVKSFKLDEVFTLDDGFKKVGLKTSFANIS